MAAWVACYDCKQSLIRVRPPAPARVRCEACQKDYDTHEGFVDRLVFEHVRALEYSRCGDVRFDPDLHEEELLRLIEAYREDDPTMAVEDLCQMVADALELSEDEGLCAYCEYVWTKDE